MMRPLERVLSALAGEWVDRPPICCMTTSVTLDQMRAVGAYWPEAHSDAKEMALLAYAAHSVVGFESVRVPFCLTVEAEIMGAKVDLGKMDRTPMVKGHPFSLGDEIEIPDNVEELGRAPVTIESIDILRKMTREDVPIVPLATGPFTIAGHLVGMENLLLGIILDPGEVHELLKKATELSQRYISALDAAHPDVILLSNPSASSDMISPETHSEFSAPYTVSCLKGIENAMSVLHICGDTTMLIDGMISTGVDGISIEEKVDPFKASGLVNGRCALMGNVGVVNPLLQGSPKDVIQATKRVMEAGFDIVNPGCGLAPRIPMDNLRAMVRTVKGF
ncbi:MAG TPA: MtaA/CmuA family methyltransferase [Methanomassiliicoccales archaeon]|nr:MtaA/CmuA family methyltransferase [Methanomassiliicoccales archaeon]